MVTPEYLKPFEGPEAGLSPKAEEMYRLLLRNQKEGVPEKMIGHGLIKELGKLVKSGQGKVRIDTGYISKFYSDYIRNNVKEQPYFATAIVLTVFNELEEHGKSYGGLSSEIMMGVLEGIRKPIKTDKEEVHIQISVYENPRRFGIETNTIVPAE
jgi:hypothetical protein